MYFVLLSIKTTSKQSYQYWGYVCDLHKSVGELRHLLLLASITGDKIHITKLKKLVADFFFSLEKINPFETCFK